MKTDNRNTSPVPREPGLGSKEAGPRVVGSPAASAVPDAGTDLEAALLAIAQEEESLTRRKTERREQYWAITISSLTATIEKLVSNGFDRTAIARALGFALNGKSSPSAK